MSSVVFLTGLQHVAALSRDGLAAHAVASQPPKFTALCVKWIIKLAIPGCCNLSGAREVTREVCNGRGVCQ